MKIYPNSFPRKPDNMHWVWGGKIVTRFRYTNHWKEWNALDGWFPILHFDAQVSGEYESYIGGDDSMDDGYEGHFSLCVALLGFRVCFYARKVIARGQFDEQEAMREIEEASGS